MQSDILPLLRLISANAVAACKREREAVEVGPFTALLHRADDMAWLNYAAPVREWSDEAELNEALAELRTVFAAPGRALRFEFLGGLWPDLPAALERAGLVCHGRMPLMACMPADLRPVSAPGVSVRPMTASDADTDEHHDLATRSFGIAMGPELKEANRKLFADGIAMGVMAALDGKPAGVASILPIDGVAELAGVGTVPEARRRGVAATVCSELARRFFAAGGRLLYLTAGSDKAQAAYAKIGFRDLPAKQLNYIEAGALHKTNWSA